jgi:hypothetical protein
MDLSNRDGKRRELCGERLFAGNNGAACTVVSQSVEIDRLPHRMAG